MNSTGKLIVNQPNKFERTFEMLKKEAAKEKDPYKREEEDVESLGELLDFMREMRDTLTFTEAVRINQLRALPKTVRIHLRRIEKKVVALDDEIIEFLKRPE